MTEGSERMTNLWQGVEQSKRVLAYLTREFRVRIVLESAVGEHGKRARCASGPWQ